MFAKLEEKIELVTRNPVSAALLAALHDRLVQPLAQAGRHLVDLVGSINLDCLACGAQRDFAVFATAQVLLQIGTHLGRNRIVD